MSLIATLGREWRLWLAAMLRSFPGNAGVRLRARIYRRWFANAPAGLHILAGVFVNGWKNISIGDNVIFDRACSLESANGTVAIGARSGFGYGTWIGADDGRITVGVDVMVGPYVVMRAANHHHEAGQPFLEQGHEVGEIVIGDNVWIGAHSSILPGANIGRNSVIAAGAVVRGNIPENCLAGGVPAKIIRQRPQPLS
jgi:acetyltransferase-like isoleucine patch superfamily enzyme